MATYDLAAPPEGVLYLAARHHLVNRPDLTFRIATSEHDRDAIYRLRAATAIDRWKVDPMLFPDGRDHDADDDVAIVVGGWRGDELVATARLIPALDDAPLPVERAFGITFADRRLTAEVGRVVVRSTGEDRRSSGLLATLAYCWALIGDRPIWVGANSSFVIRLYQHLGATPHILAPFRPHLGEDRAAVAWDMREFADAFARLARRNGGDR